MLRETLICSLKASLFSGFNKSSTVPAGNLSKASFTGAKPLIKYAFTSAFSKSAVCTAAN